MSSSGDPTLSSPQVDKLNPSESDAASDTAPSELVATVDDLLNQLSTNFNNVSSELIGKMDEMSQRLDQLEATIKAGNTPASGEDQS